LPSCCCCFLELLLVLGGVLVGHHVLADDRDLTAVRLGEALVVKVDAQGPRKVDGLDGGAAVALDRAHDDAGRLAAGGRGRRLELKVLETRGLGSRLNLVGVVVLVDGDPFNLEEHVLRVVAAAGGGKAQGVKGDGAAGGALEDLGPRRANVVADGLLKETVRGVVLRLGDGAEEGRQGENRVGGVVVLGGRETAVSVDIVVQQRAPAAIPAERVEEPAVPVQGIAGVIASAALWKKAWKKKRDEEV